tara:strand:+ start:1995 stop:4370 length:2376 start_codon:yes stop_codon:yes gene_type:complete
MAITKTVVDVNNGQYGAPAGGNNPWTKSDVLDALETAFATVAMNGGGQTNGVPVMVQSPVSFSHYQTEYALQGTLITDFEKCGGVGPATIANKTRYFKVSNSNGGTSAYRMLEEFRFFTNNVNTTTNEITIVRHGLSTNDEVTYAAGVTSPDTDYVIGGLSANQHYFVIKVDDDKIKLSQTSGGSEVNLTSQPNNSGYYLQHKDSSAYDNFTINVLMGDELNFDSSGASGAGGTFNLIRNHNSYDASKLLSSETYVQGVPSNNGSDGTTITEWRTYGYQITESEPLYADRGIEETGTDLDDYDTDSYGITKYIYVNSVNPDMKGEIVVLPSLINQNTSSSNVYRPYWKYTVPASGGRSELKLRVYRNLSPANATVSGITIHSIGSGWSDNEVFEIPGTAIGGSTPANDIVFGSGEDETSPGQKNAKPAIKVTNLGAGANFYQKSNNGKYAVARVIHDVTKTYGTTYYGFGLRESNDNKMVITSGSGWRFINHKGIHSTSTSDNTFEFGRYNGLQGLDYQKGINYVSRATDEASKYRVLTYANDNTPTNYKLQINVYRDNADTDFAVFQFVQTIDNNFVPFATFSISRGSQHGSGVYDLDYVFQDTITEFFTLNRGIQMRYGNTQYDYYSYGVKEPVNEYGKARAASYGFSRNSNAQSNPSSRYDFTTDYVNNIATYNYHNTDEVITYYRDATFDQYNNKSVNSSANFYKPIKGIPVVNNLLPVPYYLPDDFAMLQVATTPDQVFFRTGDTVTISGTEVYEIILAGYEQQQTGLNGSNNATTIGMLFLARTT